jgi:serine/threonine protein kinase
MALTPGSRIGVYEIVAAIGAGGMGEVYRARDTKLQRDVAIKVLPDLFARDPERLARFEREARTLAALNHPHIAQVYGVEESGHVHGLVMELVEGEDLSQRIERSGAIPLDEALPIALQIAEALEAAHEQGIIHRDLKPANIKVRPDGTVKVLDFGLAKALAPPDPGSPGGFRPGIENSPTITSPLAMTHLGMILGTAAYMAPEQAKGKPVDKRADIWAFGCVLYEMLTGKRPFAGEDVTDTLAAIVRADPDWPALPPDTPAVIRKLLSRCLEKDRRERLPDIGAARLELKDARTGSAIEGAPLTRVPRRRAIVPWLLFALASLAAVVAAGYAVGTRQPPDPRVYKTFIIPPAPLSGAPALRLAISPDGRRLAFVAPDSTGNTVLWVRRLDDSTARAVPDTVNASSPFWSPDSNSIAFVADSRLRRVDADGGPVLTLCTVSVAPAGSWSRQDVILFTGPKGPLIKIAATGGQTIGVMDPTPNIPEVVQISPFFLPDQRHFLYTAGAGGSRSLGVYAASLDSKETKRVLDVGSNAVYADGYILYLRETTLMAQRFDPDTLTVSDAALPVATDVQMNPSTGIGAFAVSQTGILVYQMGPSSGTQVAWLDRGGRQLDILRAQPDNRDVQLSPDGQWASLTLPDDHGPTANVWLFDLVRGLSRRFTFGQGGYSAVWSPDGRNIAYASPRSSSVDLFEKSVTGATGERLLLHDDHVKYPLGFSPDGQYLLYAINQSANSGRLRVLPMLGERKPREIVHTDDNQVPAEISPDGRWLAYVSGETGRREVFVTSFPDAQGKWQISTNGGDSPRWRPGDGKELFFVAGDKFMTAETSPHGDQFDTGPLRQLFQVRAPAPQLGTRSTYAVTRDGQRFLFNIWDPKAAFTPIGLVVNWPQSIKR